MIHYTCDSCKRHLDPETEMRYVVRIEVYATPADTDECQEDERDHLQEIQEILERLDDGDLDGDVDAMTSQALEAEAGDDLYHQLRFDLCGDCRRRFLRNPMGRATSSQFGFSQN